MTEQNISINQSESRTHDKTGIELVRIPGGVFLYGSSNVDPQALDQEKPQRTITLGEYWIGRAPVTNAQFARFVAATNYRTTAEREGSGRSWTGSLWKVVAGADWQHPGGPESSIEGKEDHPVVQVSWDDAQAFCDWAGMTLPTEEQWEKAARGTDGRIWPWGDEPPTAEQCNFHRNVGDTTQVGAYSPQGDSPWGCVDVAGNVWEWTASWHSEGKMRNMRGGSWFPSDLFCRAAYRYGESPDHRHGSVGFRVADLVAEP